jgi:hypothetical protein
MAYVRCLYARVRSLSLVTDSISPNSVHSEHFSKAFIPLLNPPYLPRRNSPRGISSGVNIIASSRPDEQQPRSSRGHGAKQGFEEQPCHEMSGFEYSTWG